VNLYSPASNLQSSIFVSHYRHTREAIDVPVGPNNKVEPGGPDLGQPTHFEPRRGWGVFTIRVPADFGMQKLVWTINVNGLNAAVSMHLDPNWVIEPDEDAASKNRPPVPRSAGRRRGGIHDTGGQPLTLALYASDVKPSTNLVGLVATLALRHSGERSEAASPQRNLRLSGTPRAAHMLGGGNLPGTRRTPRGISRTPAGITAGFPAPARWRRTDRSNEQTGTTTH
jgi:hypothetical protein